jgi:predicted nucleic acid-binding protein
LILLDASAVFAALVASQRGHEEARRSLETATPPLVLSPFVLGELDYLIAGSLGVRAELTFLEQVERGIYELARFSAREVADAHDIIARYYHLGIGLADASIVVLAGRYRTNRVLTLDERHFRALRTPGGRPFAVLPADA